MNIVSKLTVRHLLANKKRSIVTILGIATSTALISAILLGVFSFFHFFGQISIRSDGRAHAKFNELTESQINSVKKDSSIAEAGIRNLDETISGVRIDSGREERFRVGNIEHADQGYYSMAVVSDYEGTLPKNSSEIAVEESFIKDNGLDIKVGDSLSFEQGYRYIDDEFEGFMYLGGNYRSEEDFKLVSLETCTVSAIVHGNRPTAGWDILRGMDDSFIPEQKNVEMAVMLKKCDHTAIRQLKDIIKKYGISKYEINTEYMLSVFAFEGSGGSYRAFFRLMAFALLIVMMTSFVLIVNSIGMSLTERMRYLGMLASVGATGRQKRFSIYFEGFILGMIGIPLGLIMGYIGTDITLSVLGRRILEADIITGAEGMRGSIPIVCVPGVILAIILFSVITILISISLPAVKAAKIMPIDALRQTNTIKVKAKNLRINPFVQKLFGYEGELAYKNIRRNGLKGTVITASIAISVVMFLTINYFCNSVNRANQLDFNIPCQLTATCSLSESDKLRAAISNIDGVDKVFSAGMIYFPFEKESEAEETLANRDITDPEFLKPDYADMKITNMALVLADDTDFEKMLEDNGLDKEKYFDGSLRGVLLNNYFHEKKAGELFNSKILGQSLHYDETEGFPPAVEIGDFVKYDSKNYLFDMTPKGTITVYVPVSVYFEKAKTTLPEDKLVCDIGVVTADHKAVFDKIYSLMEAEGYHNYHCADLTSAVLAMNTVTMMLKTAMYGFTILLTLIAAANIINTISTGVLLRRKEFAMYKSVGMDGSGFKKMIRLETLLYGIKALSAAIPLSLVLSYLMYRTMDSKLYSFDPDLPMYLLALIVVFAIVGLSMALSIKEIKDDNIIEALKEDAV